MHLTEREKTIATTAIIAAVGAGALYVLFNRRKIVRRFTDPLYNQSVRIVSNPEDCQKVIGLLRDHCREFRVLGFDCEWVNEQGNRHPVALLQLASHRGLCALIRLCEMKRIPQELSDLLNDPAIVKVGVGPVEDAKLLRNDYNLKVESTLDLRHLAERCGIPGPYGMAKLAEATLGIKLDKHWRIRASNWENDQLTERQVAYAASDAHVAVELFRNFAKRAVPRAFYTREKTWLTNAINELECFFDQRFHDKQSSANPNKSKKKLLAVSSKTSIEIKRSMATRAKPLYDNCLMQAPDGELLCTCDRKKAEWYVIKELAEIVTDQPTYTIRLKFEPKGRAVGDVGKYYQIAKENKCVVCGAKDSYIRKNVVPRDYRRHFPLVMKEHISHDVLLLCAPCHRTSNMHDENMRLNLVSMCTAPYSVQENPKEIRVQNMTDLRKAARALVHCSDKIPEERQKGLRKKLQKLLPKGTELTAELLDHYANINVAIPNEDYFAHGEKVVEYFKHAPGGLSELEKMWREHFLQTMEPKCLPELWSVEHNYKRLEIRADEGRVDEQDLLIAGVPIPSNRNSSSENSSSSYTRSNGASDSYSYSYSQEVSVSTSMIIEQTGRESDDFENDNDSTTRDVSSYRDEEAAVDLASQSNEETAFYSDRDESETLFGSVGGASETTLGKTFRTIQTNGQPPSAKMASDDGDDESELATTNDFASIETHSYDSDDSDSTLSQPSMTLLNSTDDWDAEANEPSVNGTVLITPGTSSKVCSICGASHYTQNCPEYAKGDHIEDKPSLNLSRSSVPNGLLIMDAADGSSCVVTSQKFAKGTRFGPLLAQKSYAPVKNIPFPLVLFATPYYYGSGGELDFDLQTLFNGRNVYLDTRNTTKCNWMIHVSLARFSNEQNLICYQENDEIYYTAIKDIELGDILRVWYSRSYAAKIGAALLEPSPFDICNNILRSVSLDYGLNLDQNQNYVDSFPSTSAAGLISQSAMMTGGGGCSGNDVNNNNNNPTTTISTSAGEMVSSYDKISLPPIDSLMKTSSPKYQSSHYHMFDLDLIASGHVSMQQQSFDDYGHFNPPSAAAISQPMHHSSQHHVAPEMQQQHHHHQQQQQLQHQQLPMQQQQPQQQQQQQMVHSTYANYQTLPEDTLSPADLISISLGASDMNITFDSFGTNNLLGYDGGSSSGSNLGDSGISSVGFGGCQGGMDSKMHSRYSSSTDSLATLNDSLGMVPPPVTSNLTQSSTAPSSGGTDTDADKKYPCEICLRKYMTKSNLDKHMRKHNLFLCVFCMKLFQLAEELKDHECTERKSKTAYLHCPKCLKVLSNSWSLQRHMKIHKDPNESVLMGSMEESTTDKLLIMEPKEETVFDEIEPTPLDELKPSIDPLDGSSGDGMMLGDETCDVMNEPDPIRVQEMEMEPEYEPIQQPMVVATSSATTIPIGNTTSSQDMITDVQAPNGKQLYKCIVCAKLFKNPNALEKHLRKVHTVYTVSNDYKSEKKVMTQINQKKTSPIKPSIAKALATKLTQKSKKMEAAAASAESAVSPSVPVTPEQPVHVPRQYNKKKHLNKLATSSNAGSSMQVSPLSVAPTIVTSSSGPTASSTPNKSHSIIIISNLELTNNNLIDTSQLFINQNTNALGNKIDLKVLNSTDKLPKLVPISNHHQQPASLLPPATPQGMTQSVATNQFQGPPSIPTLHPTSGGLDGLNAIIESSGIAEETNQMMTESSSLGGTGETQLLTLSPIKISNGSESQQQMISVPDRTPDSINNGFLSPEELSTDANDNSSSNQCCDGDSDNSAQLTQTSYPCEECDRVFPKNYQLKRHMEIHDSTYYMCPYCDRSPLKAKTSVRKHLNTVHPERAPAKEEMNKFISTLVVKDEKILGELYAKNERKIRNKCAKQQAKQLQQQQQQQQQLQQQQQQQHQHQQQLMESSVGIAEQHPTVVATSTAVSHVATVQQQQQHEAPTGMVNVAPEEMLNTYQGSQQRSGGGGEQQNGSEQQQQQHGFQTVEQMSRHGERVSANVGCNGEIKSGEEESALKRRSEEQVNPGGQGGSSLREEGKKIKLVDVNGSEVRYIAATTMGGNGALKYLRKKSLGVGEGSSSSGHSMPPPGSSSGSTMDNQIMLDNLFDNISIENYEFDDNTSIQSYNLIDERFKTSFDQIQEKLDAELSFDEEQLKWQNNLMTNDSSNEIGDKLLNVEENIMLI